jgi:hypothetical protein
MEYAQRQARPGETPQQSFSRLYNAPTDEGRAIRAAFQITKRAAWAAAAPPLHRGYTDAEAIAVGKRMADAERCPSWLRF